MTLVKKASAIAPAGGNTTLFEHLFIEELKDIYWAEKHLLKSIPVLMRSACDGELYDVLANHLEETRLHISRLEKAFEILGTAPKAKKCVAMMGLTEQGNDMLDATPEVTPARDAALVFIMQKTAHYELATYAALAQLATRLGHNEIAELCYISMEEDTVMDELLMEIAEKNVYYRHDSKQ